MKNHNLFVMKELSKFLNKNHAWKEYVVNFKKDKYYDSECIQLYPRITDKTELINFAFTWAETKEGHEFWEKLHKTWKTIATKKGY